MVAVTCGYVQPCWCIAQGHHATQDDRQKSWWQSHADDAVPFVCGNGVNFAIIDNRYNDRKHTARQLATCKKQEDFGGAGFQGCFADLPTEFMLFRLGFRFAVQALSGLFPPQFSKHFQGRGAGYVRERIPSVYASFCRKLHGNARLNRVSDPLFKTTRVDGLGLRSLTKSDSSRGLIPYGGWLLWVPAVADVGKICGKWQGEDAQSRQFRPCSVNVPFSSDSNLSCRRCQQTASMVVCRHRFGFDGSRLWGSRPWGLSPTGFEAASVSLDDRLECNLY